MPNRSRLDPNVDWIRLETTPADWAAADPALLTGMLAELHLIRAFEETCGVSIPARTVGRRAGDVPRLVAGPRAVAEAWGWRTSRDLRAMVRDSWEFQRRRALELIP